MGIPTQGALSQNMPSDGAESDHSAGGNSSAASYLPGGPRAVVTGQAGAVQVNAHAVCAIQLSAQLANMQIKAKVQQQRADSAEARERELQRKLADLEAIVATGAGPAAATDKRVDVLKVRILRIIGLHVFVKQARSASCLRRLLLMRVLAECCKAVQGIVF